MSYFEARYLNTSVGKFISLDPVFLNPDPTWLADPQAQNAYAYARNNPLRYNDPDGKNAKEYLFRHTRAINNIYSVLNTTANILSLGGWGAATSMAAASGEKMATEGVSVYTVAHMSASVTAGAAVSVTGAFTAGATLGEVALATGLVGDKTANTVSQTTNAAPNFVTSSGGTTYPVPTGPTPSISRTSGIQTGSAFTGGSGGANGQVSTMRIMNPNRSNPSGYIKYENAAVPIPQGLNPYSGKTGSPSDTHFPID